MLIFTPFFYLTAILSLGQSANILGVFPSNFKSHVYMFERVLKQLAERGHNVDVVTNFSSKKELPSGYNEISIEGSQPTLVNNMPVSELVGRSYYRMIQAIVESHGADVCKNVLKNAVLKNLTKTTKKYDLVITELFGSNCMLGFGHIFKAPTVAMSSSAILPWGNDRIGNPDNPSYIPTYFASFTDRMSLYERVINTITLIASKILYQYLSIEETNQLCKDFFGPNLPDLQELGLNISLILVNSHLIVSHVRPTVANFIEVGGLHIREPKPLSQYFEDLLQTDSKGVIYFSMGSLVATETFDYKKLQGLFDAFAQLPYKILWKANREKFPKGLKIPKNIHFEPWMPQIDILCHPNVKLFISHGGLLGYQETVYCGVPLLGIPIFADQEHNIRNSIQMGLALEVAYHNINKKTILTAAQKILEDPTFKQNSERVSRQFKDRPMPPLDTAVYWIEYVIRHNGAPHLRSAGADLQWYQYYLLDVAFIIISSFLTFILVLILLLKFIFRFACDIFKQKVD